MAGQYIHSEELATTEPLAVTAPKQVSEDAPCGGTSAKVTPKTPTTEEV